MIAQIKTLTPSVFAIISFPPTADEDSHNFLLSSLSNDGDARKIISPDSLSTSFYPLQAYSCPPRLAIRPRFLRR